MIQFTILLISLLFVDAEIGFNPIVYSVEEGRGAVLVIENMTPDLERDVTVQFFTVGGSAVGMCANTTQDSSAYCCSTDGTDFLGVHESFPQVVTFSPNGQTLEYIVIPTLDDSFFEGAEDFHGSLTTTDSFVTITAPDATVQITENDSESLVYMQ